MFFLPQFTGFLRKGVSFSPSDISGLGLWLKADAITGLSDGDPVSTWLDSSGNSRDATGSGTARPSYKTGGPNGLPYLLFDGVNDEMSVAALSLTNNIPGFTCFMARKWRASPSALGYEFYVSTPSGTARVSAYAGAVSGKFGAGGRRLDGDSFAGVTSAASVSTVYEVRTVVADYANSDFFQYIDGTLDGSTTSFQTTGNTSATNSLRVMIGSSGGTQFGGIDCAEIIAYPRALNSTERGQVEAYLAAKYGL